MKALTIKHRLGALALILGPGAVTAVCGSSARPLMWPASESGAKKRVVK